MNIKELLGEQLYDVFYNSDSYMCIYNTKEDVILTINPTMKSHSNGKFKGCIKVLQLLDKYMYTTIDNIPCKMTLLVRVNDDVSIMNMSIAHTKKWGQKSDLVSLTDMTSDGVWEWFPELNFEYMSERFWNILGYEQKDMEENPMSWMGFLNPDDKIKAMKMVENTISSRGDIQYIMKARYTHQEGHEVIVLCRGSIVDWMPDGKPWRILGTHTDITDVVKKDSIEAKTKFISRMSHEIRSPVCTILNECELLGDFIKTSVIQDTCKQLLSITDDILNIENLKSSIMKLEIKPESLEEIMSKCSKRHRKSCKKKGIRLRSMIDEVPRFSLMDLGKFNQVLDNLMVNAIKYSDSV